MKVSIIISLLLFWVTGTFFAQEYTDYIGAGHSEGVTVTASSQMTRDGWNETAEAANTVNGKGLDAEFFEASRFLAQASFGAKKEYIEALAGTDFEDWIDEQFQIPRINMGDRTFEVYEEARDLWEQNGGDPEIYFGPDFFHFLYTWWEYMLTQPDYLRQRVAQALSEILVISGESDLLNFGEGFGYYYELLLEHAFGNYKDLLMAVSTNPMMAGYLTHYNNPRSIPENNTFPDENYAREIMQLFTIGLYKLNNDGTYQTDDQGNLIPTYDNTDIREMAKIFTGLSAANVIDNDWGVEASFGVNIWFCRKDLPLMMYEEWHEPGPKYLLDGYVVPAGQTGMQDIEDAVTHLFNHPNVGPFLAKRLIQHLVKSNPSPEYVDAVASAFNNTNGVRGDMKAVIKAILLHPEARECNWIHQPYQGKMQSPLIRYLNLVRQIDLDNPDDTYWNIGFDFYSSTGMAPLFAPTVFNFYQPQFSPNGPVSDAGLVAPEFQIHNSVTSIGYINQIDTWTYPEWTPVLTTWNLGLENPRLDFTQLKYYARDPEVLINELDKLFTHGQLSTNTRQAIRDAIIPIQGDNENIDYEYYRVKMALYLILISPDYVILK